MGRYLSFVVLGLAAALSASVIPQALSFVEALLGQALPLLANSRGQLSLVMLLVLCWSLRAPLSEALIWALVGGLMLDLLSVLPLGATSAALLLLVYAVKRLSWQWLRARILLLLAVTALATIFLFAWTYIALFLLGYSYDLVSALQLTLLPTLLYNLAAALPIYAGARIVQRRLESSLQGSAPSLSPAQAAGSLA